MEFDGFALGKALEFHVVKNMLQWKAEGGSSEVPVDVLMLTALRSGNFKAEGWSLETQLPEALRRLASSGHIKFDQVTNTVVLASESDLKQF